MSDTQHLSISWNEYLKSICSGLWGLQQHGELVDMTLAADGHYVKVHKMLLSLASPYMRELIATADCAHPIIFLNHVPYMTLSLLLEYIYTGEVIVPREHFKSFMEVGQALYVKGLKVNTPHHNDHLEDIVISQNELPTDENSLVEKRTRQNSVCSSNHSDRQLEEDYIDTTDFNVDNHEDNHENNQEYSQEYNQEFNQEYNQEYNPEDNHEDNHADNHEDNDEYDNNEYDDNNKEYSKDEVPSESFTKRIIPDAHAIQQRDLEGRRAVWPPDREWSPTPMHIASTRSITNVTVTVKYSLYTSFEERHAIAQGKHHGGKFIPKLDDLPSSVAVQYSLSNQGNLQLVMNRYLYNVKYVSRKTNQRKWMCTDGHWRGLKCPATVVTLDNMILRRSGAHNHPFHDRKIMKKMLAGVLYTGIHEAEKKGQVMQDKKDKNNKGQDTSMN